MTAPVKLFEIISRPDYDFFRLNMPNDNHWHVCTDSDGHWKLAWLAIEDLYDADAKAAVRIGLALLNKLPPIDIAELHDRIRKIGETK